ncbi:MAG: DUF3352 domain-containing protein [Phormidesmis sp.]
MTSKFALRSLKMPKTLSRLLPLGATLLIGGGAIAYLNFAQRAPRSLLPTGIQLVPQSALATMTLTTDELTWTKLRQFGTAETQQQFDSLLSEWKTRLFTENGYSFKRDIKPWIGDRVTLAVLSDRDATDQAPAAGTIESATQHLVLVVPIADPLKAKTLLEDGPKRSQVGLESRTYQGITVQTTKTTDGTPIESAVIGSKWLLLSNGAQGIEQAIDTYKKGRSLMDSGGYRKAINQNAAPQPPGKNVAQFYINIPALSQTLAPPSSGSADTLTEQRSLVPLQGSEGIVETALVESEGVRFQGTSWLLPKNDLAYSELRNEASEMPRRLPGDTLIMMSGSNLQQFWQGFSEGNTSPPFFPDPQTLKAGLLTQTGLDLDEDIMPWAAGEFSLALLPPESNLRGTADPDTESAEVDPSEADPSEVDPSINSAPLMIMVQTNDRRAAESVWAQLDNVMASRYRFDVETNEFEGGSVTEWISPFQGVQFSHGWLPGNVTFFGIGTGIGNAIAPSPESPLAIARPFQLLTSKAPTPNNGHFYINLAQINATDGGVFPLPQLSTEGATAAIEAVGLTTQVNNRTMDYDLYVRLAKGDQPEPF